MPDFLDQDVVGFARSAADSIVTTLFIRAGHLIGPEIFIFLNPGI